MEATFSYLLMPEKYISSKQKTQKSKNIHYVWIIFQKILLPIIRKTQDYVLLPFLSIAIALMIAVSIYCYSIKHRAKQNHLLQFHVTNKELKEIMY